MGILEGILYTMWRGLAIGIIISAPMGPVGILCVQRTLDKGRRTGLYTGVGAAISDLLYCLLTGFGLSFIEEFLERNSNIIQLIGSLVLIGFGVYLFKSNPSRKLKKPSEQKIPAGRNILNGFLFTVSNPLIIFLIIGLFARFNFLMPEIRFYHYIIGFVFIFLGALLWWYVVTFFVDKVRAHFNLRSMWLVNKIIGGVIFLFAIVGIITAITGIASASTSSVYMNRHRGFTGFASASDSAFLVENKGKDIKYDIVAAPPGGNLTWKFRAADLSGSEWGMVLKGKKTFVISLKKVDDRFDETYTSPHLEMTVKIGDNVCEKKRFFSDFDLYGGENAFMINIDSSGWKLRGGNRNYKTMSEFLSEGFDADSIGYALWPGGKLDVDHICLETAGVSSGGFPHFGNTEDLMAYLDRSSDSMEGIWGVFDLMLEDDRLRMGGDYLLALVKSDTGYDILYMGGAVKNPSSWSPGILKGRLVASPFEGIYNVEWIDVTGKTVEGIKAQSDNGLLRLVFPDDSSELRLRKVTSSL